MSEQSMQQAVRQNSESTDRIVSAARDLFAEHGFGQVNVGQIAAAANTSKANVFYHFGSKRDLYLAAMKLAMEDYHESFDQFDASGEYSDDVLERFVRTVSLRELLDSTNQTDVSLLIRGLIDQHDEESALIVKQLSQQAFERYTEVIASLMDSDVIDDQVDARTLAVLLSASHFMYMLFLPYLKEALPTPDEYGAQVVRILSQGVIKS